MEINIKDVILDLDELSVELRKAGYGFYAFLHNVPKESIPETYSADLTIFPREEPKIRLPFFLKRYAQSMFPQKENSEVDKEINHEPDIN